MPDAATLDTHLVATRGSFALDVPLQVAGGEVVALLGPNGSGKSTVLRALAGLLPLGAGHIALAGRILDQPSAGIFVPPEDRPIGVVFQDYLLFPHMTVLENVAFGLRSRGTGKAPARQAALSWLERLEVGDFADRRPKAVSGGQAQRVALARALAADPSLLLLDEPMAALDAGTRALVRSQLRRHLAELVVPTVLVTHDPVDAMVLADRIVVIEAGSVVQEGTPAEVSRHPRTDYVARLVGLNLLRGHAADGTVELAAGGRVHLADRDLAGEVLVAVRPESIALHRRRPEGSPRNVWAGSVRGWDGHGDRVRVDVAGPPDVVVDITPGALAELRLEPGDPVWATTKATDLVVYPAG